MLIRNKGLVKTVEFKNDRYLGDPINAVRIFNEKQSDEILILDIDATTKGMEPDYEFIGKLASECRMPVCYGGGIKTVEQALRIFQLGVEKVALSSAALKNPKLISELSKAVGSQSIVVVLDVRRNFLGKYEIFTDNGKNKHQEKITEVLSRLYKEQVGEILINSIDQDGKMLAPDMQLISKISPLVHCQLTVQGGIGSLDDIKKIYSRFGHINVSVGSFFVFKGKLRAVLISYPDKVQKKELYQSLHQ